MSSNNLISRLLAYVSRLFLPTTRSQQESATIIAATDRRVPSPSVGSTSTSPSETISTKTRPIVASESGAAAASSSNLHQQSMATIRTSATTTFVEIARQFSTVKPHLPQIKFIGARQPRPNTHPSTQHTIEKSNEIVVNASSSSDIVSSSSSGRSSSIGPVGKTPRGSGIDDSQLPPSLQRRPILDTEINAINLGTAYHVR